VENDRRSSEKEYISGEKTQTLPDIRLGERRVIPSPDVDRAGEKQPFIHRLFTGERCRLGFRFCPRYRHREKPKWGAFPHFSTVIHRTR
jgi:hypothetical protein